MTSHLFKANVTMILSLSRPNMNTTVALELAHGRSTKQSCLLATKLTLLVVVTESEAKILSVFCERK